MLGRPFGRLRSITAAGLLALTPMLGAHARGQDEPVAPPEDPARMLGERLLSLVEGTLDGRSQPRADQLVRARILLEQALKLVPDDAESWRLRLELADRLDDKAGGLDALKNYCRLRPEDDAAQWDLIQRSIAQKQTIEQRTAGVTNLADGPSAGNLSPALRSRLATYLARAAMERGDNKEFASRLRTALLLDPANARAAGMAYELALSRNAPPLDRGVTLMGMIKAAPTDPVARWQMGNLLLSQGAYIEAAGQLGAAKNVSTAPLPPQEAASYYASLAIALASGGQTNQALALLNQLDAAWAPGNAPSSAASAPADAPATAPATTAPVSAAPTVNAGLPIDLEVLRAALLWHQGGAARAEGALRRVREDAARRAKAAGQAGLLAASEQAWIELLFYDAADTVAAAQLLNRLPAMVEKTPADSPTGQRLRGWLLLRSGKADEARKALTPLAATDPFAAYGLALSYSSTEHERRDWLNKAAELGASGLAGMLAAVELRAAGVVSTASATPVGLALGDRIGEWPRLLANPNPAEQAWIVLALSVEPHRSSFLEPIRATLRIRNATDMPLAMGPEGTVPTRVFLITTLRPGQSGMTELPPRVIDIHRRLRLDGRQSLDVPIRLDRGRLGALFASSGTETIQLNTLAMLDAYPVPGGRYITGPLGAADMARLIERQGVPASAANVTSWMDLLNPQAEPSARMRALALLPEAVRQSRGPEGAPAAAKMTKALIDAFPKLDPIAQTWLLSFLPGPEHPGGGGEAFKPIHDAAERSADPLVRMMNLVVAVRDPKSPTMNAALRSDNRTLVEFATALRQGLEAAAAAPAPTTGPAIP